MNIFNKYHLALQDLLQSYSNEIPKNISSIEHSKPTWDDPVWYILDVDTGIRHRYLFTKAVKGQRRSKNDSYFRKLKNYESDLLTKNYELLLKVYALDVQQQKIVNNGKQFRVTVASQILTESEKYRNLNDLPIKFWNDCKESNFFWDFCKRHHLISGNLRPHHSDRLRSADDIFDRANKNGFKMPKESMIFSIGYIFNEVFRDVNENGKLGEEGMINIVDAIPITVALLGLASPCRLNSEIPLLQNQKLKSIKPKSGEPIYYLDWPGSKGYQDNQNHVLKALAPHVKKAINFFHEYFQPERYYVRFLKNTKQSWKQLLNGFIVDPNRTEELDFSQPPNIFTVAYALGFYPIKYKVEVLKCHNSILLGVSERQWKWNLKRGQTKSSQLIEKNISKLLLSDLVINLSAVDTTTPSKYSIQRLLQTENFTKSFKNRLTIQFLTDIGSLQKEIIRLQKENIPTFPKCYIESEKYIDLEHALFCIAPNKHNFNSVHGMSGSPLNIISLRKVKTIFVNAFSDNNPATNIFNKYGFKTEKLRLHSLRHFANTYAEKGGIPLSVIASWSGRTSIKQTLEYIHNNVETNADRVTSTLDLDASHIDIRVITNDELKTYGGLPASITDTGICVQELSVTPCNYINNFLSGCFLCESSCYICGDTDAIKLLEYDLRFQSIRLARLSKQENIFKSPCKKDWYLKHTKEVALLEQLIQILKNRLHGNIARISTEEKKIFITNPKTNVIDEVKLTISSDENILNQITDKTSSISSIPEGMTALLSSFGVTNFKNKSK